MCGSWPRPRRKRHRSRSGSRHNVREQIGARACLRSNKEIPSMNKRIAAAATVLVLSTTLAFAGPGHGRGHGRHGKGGFGAKFAQELNLTEDQHCLIAEVARKSGR